MHRSIHSIIFLYHSHIYYIRSSIHPIFLPNVKFKVKILFIHATISNNTKNKARQHPVIKLFVVSFSATIINTEQILLCTSYKANSWSDIKPPQVYDFFTAAAAVYEHHLLYYNSSNVWTIRSFSTKFIAFPDTSIVERRWWKEYINQCSIDNLCHSYTETWPYHFGLLN